jgi:hypothetical protein
MNKTELESKHIAELHELAAEAGVERYRMLSRAELIEKLSGGNGKAQPKSQGERRGGDSSRRGQRDRARSREPRDKQRREPRPEPQAAEPAPEPPAAAPTGERPKRKRRRRRWGRRRKGVRVHDLLLPTVPGRQAIVYAESRAACTALLREVAAELSEASKGPDPIALLVDPTPEELADWKREAPRAEIVSAGKANHAGDAIAQAQSRAAAGEEVVVLIDSLTRFAETFGGADEARGLLDAGQVTVIAALERPA